MRTLSSIVDSLTSAKLGNRDLDGDIAEALGQEVRRRYLYRNVATCVCRPVANQGRWRMVPRYTTSLDAAMLLYGRHVPKMVNSNPLVECADALLHLARIKAAV